MALALPGLAADIRDDPDRFIDEQARRRLVRFTARMFDRYEPAQHHQTIAAKLEAVERGDTDRLIITMPPRHGKQLANSTPVPTPTGWKYHGDLVPGDAVFGVDGKPVQVVAVSDPTIATLDVTFSDGSILKTHPLHEWTVYDRAQATWRTMETRTIAARTLTYGEKRRCVLQLPARPSLDLPRVSLPIDPYVFGAWLGDGTQGKTVVTHHKDDVAVVGAIVAAGHERTHAWDANGGTTLQSNFPSLKPGLEVSGAYHQKHIPPRYLRASEDQRLELLAGLIDTDGSVGKDGRVRIVTVSDALAQDVMELIRTLGWRASVSTQAPTLSTSGIQGVRPVHYIGFTPDRPIPTRMPNKIVLGNEGCQRRVGIVSVQESADPEPGRCIQVNRLDGLYLVGTAMIPTHNSTLASEHFPPWYLGRNPEHRIIACSHTAQLAYDFSRRARNKLTDPRYPFDVRVADDRGAVQSWDIEGHRGGYVAAGVGGPITGFGANILLIDDPVKSAEEADSVTYRESTWEWWTGTAATRLEPGGAVVVIGTRWHEDDLIGRLLQSGRWDVLHLPAIDADGNALWPERFNVDALQTIREEIGPRHFTAQYQGDPQPAEGGMFKPGWWQRYREAPALRRVELFVDSAFKEGVANDFSVIATWGETGDGTYYLLDLWRGRVEYPDLIRACHDQWTKQRARRGAKSIVIEDKASGQSALQTLGRPYHTESGRLPALPAIAYKVPAGQSKVARAEGVTGLVEAGRVFIPESAPWVSDFVDEHARFPTGVHDDQVDTTSMALTRFGLSAQSGIMWSV